MVYTTALFSDAHVLRRSHNDDDVGDPDGDGTLMWLDSLDMVQDVCFPMDADSWERLEVRGSAMRKDSKMLPRLLH
jgi:hypothetical protein